MSKDTTKRLINQGIVGIVTGIITTVILFIISQVWFSQLEPFFKSISYEGVEVEGQWSNSWENDDPREGVRYSNEWNLSLKQNAHDLTGNLIFKYKDKDKNRSVYIIFDVNGYMWEGFLTLNFIPKDHRITSYATGLFKLNKGGAVLDGQWLFRNIDVEEVDHYSLKLKRDLLHRRY